MNDPKLALDRIESILKKAQSWSEPEQLAAYAAIMNLIRDLDEYVRELEFPGSDNASFKLNGIRWHVSAMFGMDIANGHDAGSHCAWAFGDINDLRGIFDRAQ